jgi:hypothetical protein
MTSANDYPVAPRMLTMPMPPAAGYRARGRTVPLPDRFHELQKFAAHEITFGRGRPFSRESGPAAASGVSPIKGASTENPRSLEEKESKLPTKFPRNI